jgi:SEC-C motif-containing protein
MSRKVAKRACPCGSGHQLEACCGRHHSGVSAPDAEALMRSRYTAYVLGDAAYLLATWHASTRPQTLKLDETPGPKWLGLQVKRFETTGTDSAIVEFIARRRIGGRAQRMHEISRFVREDGRWYYVGGSFPTGGDDYR